MSPTTRSIAPRRSARIANRLAALKSLQSPPTPRRSARLAEKRYRAEYRSVLFTLGRYRSRVDSETTRDNKVWQVNNYLEYTIRVVTGPRAVPSFIQALQSCRAARDVWTNKCRELIQDISVNPTSHAHENAFLVENCTTLLDILADMNFKALEQTN